MKQKHINAAHETRMWISQVIIPAVVETIAVMSKPQAKTWISDKVANAKNKVKNLFHKN